MRRRSDQSEASAQPAGPADLGVTGASGGALDGRAPLSSSCPVLTPRLWALPSVQCVSPVSVPAPPISVFSPFAPAAAAAAAAVLGSEPLFSMGSEGAEVVVCASGTS